VQRYGTNISYFSQKPKFKNYKWWNQRTFALLYAKFVLCKKLAARISAKKGQILPSLRRFSRPMYCIELKKAACLTIICLLF
jgi:hypothetical protein